MSDRYQSAVISVIQTENDSINWSKALQLIDFLNRARTHDSEIFETIHNIAIAGDRRLKLNTISFIDALFKNGNSSLLVALQNSRSILGISDDPVVTDPYVHRVLCSAAESWANVCQKHKCLQNHFLDWQRRLFSFRYKYVMTPEMQSKFSADFSTAFELLTMFAQALIDAKTHRQSADDEMLTEMVTNVIEVYQRLKELKTTMSDKYVISIINYLESFCEICKQCYSSFSQSGEFNDDILKDISSQGIPNPNQPSKPIQQPQPQPQMQPPMQPPFQPQQPQQPAIVDDLLDLSFGSPQPPQQPQYQQPPVPQQQFSQPPPPQPFQPPFIPPPQPQAPFMPQQQMQPPKPNNDFEFADDLESGGVSDQQFTAFFNGIQTKK